MRRSRKAELSGDDAGDPLKARESAVALIARRDFASTELKQKLEGQGYTAEAVEEAVAELVDSGILNDVRYLEHFVAYHGERGQGPVRIASLLRELGLSGEAIQTALAAGPDWRARAREVRIRRFGLEEPASWAEKAKQGRFLQYRGFSSDHIRAALGPDFDPNE
jgi:regulatory protein